MSQETNHILCTEARNDLRDDYAFVRYVELPKAIAEDNLDLVIACVADIQDCEEILFLDLAARFDLV
jgi:hypothetical protein